MHGLVFVRKAVEVGNFFFVSGCLNQVVDLGLVRSESRYLAVRLVRKGQAHGNVEYCNSLHLACLYFSPPTPLFCSFCLVLKPQFEFAGSKR